jgi:hypothetical protein
MLTVVLAPTMGAFVTTQTVVAQQRAIETNQAIARAMVEFARHNNGRLPVPVQLSGQGINFGIAPPGETQFHTLTPFLVREGLPPSLHNDDGSASRRVRTFQMAPQTGIAMVPLFGSSGPMVRLTYDYGVIYQTNCPRADTTCNISGQVPRDRGGSARIGNNLLVPGQHANFQSRPSDVAVTFVSTLEVEMEKLAEFARQIQEIRDTMTAYRATGPHRCPTAWLNDPVTGVYAFGNRNPVPMCLRDCAAGEDCDRFIDYNDPRWPSQSLATQEKNVNRQGCWDGWYRLGRDLNQPFLRALGLLAVPPGGIFYSPGTTRGFTPWSGVIEYCADYEPNVHSGYTADQPPHMAALRFTIDVRDPRINLGFIPQEELIVISW